MPFGLCTCPRTPARRIVTERAGLIAERQSTAVEHTMRLENQAVKDKEAARAASANDRGAIAGT